MFRVSIKKKKKYTKPVFSFAESKCIRNFLKEWNNELESRKWVIEWEERRKKEKKNQTKQNEKMNKRNQKENKGDDIL